MLSSSNNKGTDGEKAGEVFASKANSAINSKDKVGEQPTSSLTDNEESAPSDSSPIAKKS